MSLEVIYVTRHGFRSGWSVDPLTGVYTATIRSPTGIPADPALTSYGVSQAKEMGKHLMTLEPPIDVVYSSPYYRCLQTITPFIELKQQQLEEEPGTTHGSATATIRPEHGLGEFFGAAPFDHPIPASHKRLKELFPAYDDSYVSAIKPSRKGETIENLYGRVAVAMRGIVERCDAEGKRAVVLCTHAAVVIALGRVLTGRVPEAVEEEDFHAFTCGLSTYRRRRQGTGTQVPSTDESQPFISKAIPVGLGEWQCELDSDCSFLSSGEERGWRFSGDESFPGTGSMSQGGVESKL
ncbi:hypothetical protein SNK03_008289 [Fusarium graminearum]|uniref:Chromosome 4, complete genome n=1 Tax=Gibberella zeae (strain ATCC MYA-4620 / CBS 123657 / FGSC 9075 / NRRL 31084 / PH-1) TaxID=229533 RepID=V6RFX5_GIBZE|nr:hypothetical protein FGSG_06967 [Fusarium graminearum PH-1]ESU13139.1 hypothetical protein FGSG_06967 [Fusarium graminearum PH-1]EYB23749.1 hypothetical protein FG05_06967 [Fusarium graminearum]CAF3464912.1 unnamed protein product [Fusarium graminearum]CEF83600.1 unnamed protein product [Fusarium graminearum]|eukprot:XP_011326646.1 hypothetical protein FGSG_06967 [Fusarium graminearum PH-1]